MYSDLENYNGLGIAFVTASPVLTNEVWRYYLELLEKIWLHFKEKYGKKLKSELTEEEEEEFTLLNEMKESVNIALAETK